MTPSGMLFPTQTQATIDTDEPAPRAPGALIRFLATTRNITGGQPSLPGFYDPAVELADDFRNADVAFWKSVRPDSLSANELRAMRVVDSVRNAPFIKATSEITKLGVLGYKPINRLNIDFGPVLYSYADNSVEGHRFRVGGRTNTGFSRKWLLSGYIAYGTLDRTLKYSAGVEYVVNRKPWTVLGIRRTYDLERIGVSADNIGNNSLFAAYSRFGTIRRPYSQQENLAYFRRELGRGFTQTVALRNRTFEPLFPFAFRPQLRDNDQAVRTTYRITGLISETRFAADEIMLQNDNVRVSAGTTHIIPCATPLAFATCRAAISPTNASPSPCGTRSEWAYWAGRTTHWARVSFRPRYPTRCFTLRWVTNRCFTSTVRTT